MEAEDYQLISEYILFSSDSDLTLTEYLEPLTFEDDTTQENIRYIIENKSEILKAIEQDDIYNIGKSEMSTKIDSLEDKLTGFDTSSQTNSSRLEKGRFGSINEPSSLISQRTTNRSSVSKLQLKEQVTSLLADKRMVQELFVVVSRSLEGLNDDNVGKKMDNIAAISSYLDLDKHENFHPIYGDYSDKIDAETLTHIASNMRTPMHFEHACGAVCAGVNVDHAVKIISILSDEDIQVLDEMIYDGNVKITEAITAIEHNVKPAIVKKMQQSGLSLTPENFSIISKASSDEEQEHLASLDSDDSLKKEYEESLAKMFDLNINRILEAVDISEAHPALVKSVKQLIGDNHAFLRDHIEIGNTIENVRGVEKEESNVGIDFVPAVLPPRDLRDAALSAVRKINEAQGIGRVAIISYSDKFLYSSFPVVYNDDDIESLVKRNILNLASWSSENSNGFYVNEDELNLPSDMFSDESLEKPFAVVWYIHSLDIREGYKNSEKEVKHIASLIRTSLPNIDIDDKTMDEFMANFYYSMKDFDMKGAEFVEALEF